jgi:AAA family ATP:ADP antiporter
MLSKLPQLFLRMIRSAAGIPDDEIKVAWGSFCFAFILMTAYYILRPIRDAMSSNWTDTELSALFTGTFIASSVSTLLYGFACSRIPIRKLIPGVYIFFSLTFVSFYVILRFLPAGSGFNKYFYVWVSVFSLFQFSVFWTFMADIFSSAQAARLFGFISAGGSSGAILGPMLALFLIGVCGLPNLILISALLLMMPVFFIRYLNKQKQEDAQRAAVAIEHPAPRLGGHFFSGFAHLLRDPYLLGIGVFVLLFAIIGTFIYFELKNLLTGVDLVTRTRIWSGMDLAVNILSIATAFLITGRLTTRFGLSKVLALIPAITFVGLLWVAVVPMLWVVVVIQCARRSGDYAVTRPGREMLFTVVSRENRYKAKSAIDNVVYRGGDVLAAWCFTGLSQGLGAGVAIIATTGAIIALAWACTGIYLGRWYDHHADNPLGAEEP